MDNLSSMDGLNNLSSVGYLAINSNPALENLDGLSNLINVELDVNITSNPSLNTCTGLKPLLDYIDHPPAGPGPGPAGIADVGGNVNIGGNGENCNSTDDILVSVAAFFVNKTFGDGNPLAVMTSLDCDNPGVVITTGTSQASASMPALFQIDELQPGVPVTCSATESSTPGYTADDTDCQNVEVLGGSQFSCTIINLQNPIALSVKKFYANDNPDDDPEVEVTVTCDTANVHPGATQITTGGVAEFQLADYQYEGEKCTVTESLMPDYYQLESEGCESFGIYPGLGQAPVCSFTNEWRLWFFKDGFDELE